MIGALVFWTTDTSLITVILTHGTNQLQYEDQRIVLTKAEIKQRTIGSKSFIIVRMASLLQYAFVLIKSTGLVHVYNRDLVLQILRGHVLQR